MREKRSPQAALIFDFDGTLVDSSDIKARAFAVAITDLTGASEGDVRRAYRAHGTLNRLPQLARAFRDLAGREPDDEELAALVSTYGHFVRERSHEVRVFGGMQQFLDSQEPTHCLAVASNAPQDELEAACVELGLERYFDSIYGYPTSKEAAIAEVRTSYNLPSSHVLYIGDRLEDEAIARRAGVAFCRFGPLEPNEGTEVVVRTISGLQQAVQAFEIT